MRVDAFDFELPERLIADRPVRPRDAARLLVVQPDAFDDRHVRDLPDLLRAGDLLVFNDTKVIPARLRGRRGEASVEITLHRRIDADTWMVFARPAKRLNPGQTVLFNQDLTADVVSKGEGGEVELRFVSTGCSLDEAFIAIGDMPLPPYIAKQRPIDDRDEDDYQTMFAAQAGAVAAPTAGLHFTPTLLERLEAAGIRSAAVTLHVGAGTFLPVKADDTADHRMHSEWGRVPAETVRAVAETRTAGGRIVALGTTSLRLLESAAAEDGTVRAFEGETDIFITPGYRFRAIDMLMTNFHLPRSTLFMLVAAFSGLERMQAAYAHAIAQEYRFYSYGDACLLYPASS